LSSAAAFVNALLRRAVREPEYDPATGVSDPIEQVAVRTSHPLWLIERWASWLGLDQAETFAHANNLVPPTAFRVVAKRAGQSEILSKLSAAGAALESSDVVDGGWRVSGATALLRELSAAGEIYLQDEASQLVAQLVDAKRGERVLDVCAAPGGKTTMIADRSGDGAFVVAGDRSVIRMETVVATTRLHQLEGIRPVILDAAEQLPFWPRTFDKVLVDAPCSGTGTLRRNPEIRWRLTPDDIGVLVEQQKRILNRALEMVKPGGRLVYSTCSVEREENEDVIEIVSDQFRIFETVRTWPHREGSDGFFVAAAERI
jgi:16S rRNA (cytosine967-C5)-methyltransferase